ncbi:glycosyltransferase family 1 protein [Microvirga rosea]|nr:glycosyltransferase family 1 protein [Microvirga rosea]
MPVRRSDVLAADLARPTFHLKRLPAPDKLIVLNWIMSPPAPGSGGHTTIFRIIRHLEKNGYSNRVYFYDPHQSDHSYYENIVRRYYEFQGPVDNVDNGMRDAHGVVATSWPTAYAAYNSACTGKRFYFVQDYEPFFHPVSTASVLAENTYRMNFHGITAGRWLATKLQAEYGMTADFFDFGCDTSRYVYDERVERKGVVYYGRSDARRGFELGIMALEIFSKHCPNVEIHLYGDKAGPLPFDYVDHGWATPERLNEIYNRCFAGLSLSLTNVSLVPYEMLAAGCIPVINEAEQNRLVLDNPFVRYAEPTPQALAAELEILINAQNAQQLRQQAALSVSSADWEQAGIKVNSAIRRAIQAGYEGASPRLLSSLIE